MNESRINEIIRTGNIEEMEKFFSRKEVDVNAIFNNGYSLLSKVLYSENTEMLNLLIKYNVDVNKPYSVALKKNESTVRTTYYPAMIPLMKDNVEHMDILLKNGLDDVYNPGDYATVLDIFDQAIVKKSHKVLSLLLERKVRINDPYMYIVNHNYKNIEREPIVREIKTAKIAFQAIEQGYADDLKTFILLKLLDDFCTKPQYKSYVKIFEILNKQMGNSEFWKEQQIKLFATPVYTNSEREDMKIKQFIFSQLNLTESTIVDMYKKLANSKNITAFKVLEKNNVFNQVHIKNDLGIEIFDSIANAQNEFNKEKSIGIIEILLRNGLPIENERVITYSQKYLPESYSTIEKECLNKLFSNGETNKPKIIKRI